MPKQKKIRVCKGRHCRLFGAERIMNKLEDEYKLRAGESSDTIDLDYSECRGYCSTGPNVDVDSEIIFMAESDTIVKEINTIHSSPKQKKAKIDINDNFLGDI